MRIKLQTIFLISASFICILCPLTCGPNFIEIKHPPTLLTPANNAVLNSTQVNFTWTTVTGAEYYQIYIDYTWISDIYNDTQFTFNVNNYTNPHHWSIRAGNNFDLYPTQTWEFLVLPDCSSNPTLDIQAEAVGWIGGGSNGWKTYNAVNPISGDYQSLLGMHGILTDCLGYLYITDLSNKRLNKWESEGNAVGWIGGGSNGWKTGYGANTGTDFQSFGEPWGLGMDSSGNFYIADTANNRVAKWSNNGNAIGWIGGGSNGWKTTSSTFKGTDFQSFNSPMGLALDSLGNIYVGDSYNNRISKWDSNGNALGWIGGGSNGWQTTTGSKPGADYQSFGGSFFFTLIWSVAIDSNGNIFAADTYNFRVTKWSSDGNALGWIGAGANGWKTSTGSFIGADFQSFNYPCQVLIQPNGDLLISDKFNYRVNKWDGNGNAIGWMGNGANGWSTSGIVNLGTDYQSFNGPEGMALDYLGNLYITDDGNHRVNKWR